MVQHATRGVREETWPCTKDPQSCKGCPDRQVLKQTQAPVIADHVKTPSACRTAARHSPLRASVLPGPRASEAACPSYFSLLYYLLARGQGTQGDESSLKGADPDQTPSVEQPSAAGSSIKALPIWKSSKLPPLCSCTPLYGHLHPRDSLSSCYRALFLYFHTLWYCIIHYAPCAHSSTCS